MSVSESGPAGSQRHPNPAAAGARQRTRSASTIAILGVITAVLTLATTGLGLLAATKSNQANTATERAGSASSVAQTAEANGVQLSSQLDSAAAQAALLSSSISSLQLENKSLRSQLTPTAAGAATSSVPTKPAGAVRHRGEITIAEEGETINMNAPASDPKWALGAGNGTSGEVYFEHQRLHFNVPKSAEVDSRKSVDFETCSDLTTYVQGGMILYNNVGAGLSPSDSFAWCFELSPTRYGSFRITKYDYDRATVSLELITWE